MPYGTFDVNVAHEERKRIAEKSGQSTLFWKPSDGRNLVRFLPPWSEQIREFWKRVQVHFDMRDEDGRFTRYVCPRTVNRTNPCPICTHVNVLYRSGNEQDRQVASRIKANTRYYYNVYHQIDGVAPRVWVWDAPRTFHEQKLLLQLTDYGNITDPQTGRTMIVAKITDQSKGIPSYELYPEANPSAIRPEVIKLLSFPPITQLSSEQGEKGWGLYDLNAILVVESAQVLQNALDRRMAATPGGPAVSTGTPPWGGSTGGSMPAVTNVPPVSAFTVTPSIASVPVTAMPNIPSSAQPPAPPSKVKWGTDLDAFEKSLKGNNGATQSEGSVSGTGSR